MKRLFYITCLILFLLAPLPVNSWDRDSHISKAFKLLQEGDAQEKKIALKNLHILGRDDLRKNKDIFQPVIVALRDENPSVRVAAASTFKYIGEYSKGCCRESQMIPALIEALNDSNPEVRSETATALGYFPDVRSLTPLIEKLKDKDPWVRLNAVHTLGAFSGKMNMWTIHQTDAVVKQILDPLLDLLNDNSDWRNKYVQQECIIALRKIGFVKKEMIVPILIKKSEDEFLRAEIIKTFGKFRIFAAKHIFVEALDDPDEHIRVLALKAMRRLPGGSGDFVRKKIREWALKSLNDPSVQIRMEAVTSLGKARDERDIDELINATKDNSRQVQEAAIKALGNFRDKRVLPALIDHLSGSPGYSTAPAYKSCRSEIMRTGEKKVYIYRKDGVRHVTEDRKEVPKGVPSVERITHPTAVEYLEKSLRDSNESKKLNILRMLLQFEDKRIEQILLRLLKDDSPQVRLEVAKQLLWCCSNEAMPHLIEALNDKYSAVRAQSAKVLGKLKNRAAVDRLINTLNDHDRTVREAAAVALGELHDERAIDPLIEAMNDNNQKVRRAVLMSLKQYDDPRIADVLLGVLHDSSEPLILRGAAITPDERAIETLILFLEEPDKNIPVYAANALGMIRDKRAVEPLIKIFQSEADGFMKVRGGTESTRAADVSGSMKYRGNTQLMRAAAEALGRIGGEEAISVLSAVVDTSGNDFLKSTAIKALGLTRDERAIPVLSKMLSDENLGVRMSSISAIGEIGDPAALNVLEPVLNSDARSDVKYKTIEAIAKTDDPISWQIITDFINNSPDDVAISNSLLILGKSKDEKMLNLILSTCGKKRRYFGQAMTVLKAVDESDLTGTLLRHLKEEDVYVKRCTLSLLGNYGDKSAIKPLKMYLDHDDLYVRSSAREAIRLINKSENDAYEANTAFEFNISRLSDNDKNKRRLAASRLGALENQESIKHLTPLLHDKDAGVRREAVVALGRLKAAEAVPAIINRLQDTSEFGNVRSAAASVLGTIGDVRAVEPLANAMIDKDKSVITQSMQSLRKMKNDPAVSNLLAKLFIKEFKQDNITRVVNILMILNKEDILSNLNDTGNEDIQTITNYLDFIELNYGDLSNTRYSSRSAVIKQLTAIQKDDIKKSEDETLQTTVDITALRDTLKSENAQVRLESADKLGDSGNIDAGQYLVPLLKDRDPYVRQAASRALGQLGYKGAEEGLIEGLGDKDEYVRAYSSWSLGETGGPNAVKPLLDSLDDKDSKVKEWSKESLMKLKRDQEVLNLLFKLLRISFDVKDYSMISRLVNVLSDDDILEAFKDTGGDDRKTIHKYVALLESTYSRLSKTGDKGLKEYKNRSLVIQELSSLITSAKDINDRIVFFLRKLNDPEAIPAFIHILENRANFSISSKRNAVDLLTALQHKEASGLLLELLMDSKEFEGVRSSAAKALGKLGVKEAGKVMIDILQKKEEHKEVRKGAAMALGDLKDERALQTLITVLRDNTEDVRLRVASVNSLADLGTEESVAALREFSNDPSPYVKNAVNTALRKF